jgi:trehalose-phosphatase
MPGLLLAGSGGLEWEIDGVYGAVPEAAAGMRAVAAVAADLAGRLARVPGVWLESKPHGLTIHHRDADREAVAMIRGLAAELQAGQAADVRVVACALGVEITPCPAHHKGSAVRMLIAAVRAEPTQVVYAGNDANDAEAMAEVARRGGCTLAVGPDAPPADQRLDGPESLADWLEAWAAAFACRTATARRCGDPV